MKWIIYSYKSTSDLKGKLDRGPFREKKKKKKHAWVEHFTPTPKRPPFTYIFRFVHVGSMGGVTDVITHSMFHFNRFSSFGSPGVKFTISDRLREWLLQQCYALTCYTVKISIPDMHHPRPDHQC